jgi:4-hydroxy-2-oxoheptanedioate aldolase
MKKALAAKETLYGLWLALADAYSTEVCATAGFDWLLIDSEHAPNDLRTILAQLQTIAAFTSHAVVRLPSQDPIFIKQVLEIGARNLLIPMVETSEQAKALVTASYYPPLGTRGVGSSIARVSGFSKNSSYLKSANANICLLAQVESVCGIESLEAIAGVAGIDGIFIGPADLAASLGYLGEPQHPVVQEVIRSAALRLRAVGKPAGILVTNEQAAHSALAWGYTFVALGVDTLLLANATRQLLKQYKDC